MIYCFRALSPVKLLIVSIYPNYLFKILRMSAEILFLAR